MKNNKETIIYLYTRKIQNHETTLCITNYNKSFIECMIVHVLNA